MNLQTVLLCGLAVAVHGFGRKQTVSVKGKLTCPSEPHKARNVRVKLMDEDWGPDPDDLMAEGSTAGDGSFGLFGQISEFTRIDPFLKIYHDCLDGAKPCQRKWKMKIPNSYINSKKTYDLGVVNLEMKLAGEERDCIH